MNNRVAKGLFWGGNLGIVYLGRVPDDNVIEGLRKNDLVLSEKLTKEFPIGRDARDSTLNFKQVVGGSNDWMRLRRIRSTLTKVPVSYSWLENNKSLDKGLSNPQDFLEHNALIQGTVFYVIRSWREHGSPGKFLKGSELSTVGVNAFEMMKEVQDQFPEFDHEK